MNVHLPGREPRWMHVHNLRGIESVRFRTTRVPAGTPRRPESTHTISARSSKRHAPTRAPVAALAAPASQA